MDGRLLRGVRELNLLFFQQTAEFLCLRISVQGFRLKGFRDFFGLDVGYKRLLASFFGVSKVFGEAPVGFEVSEARTLNYWSLGCRVYWI